MTGTFTRKEEGLIKDALSRGGDASCPRCGKAMDATPIPPRGDVSYVRKRVLLRCPFCDLRCVVDRK